ncbi:hypothetical protein ACK3TF_003862 [Chlorella vulgaris]
MLSRAAALGSSAAPQASAAARRRPCHATQPRRAAQLPGTSLPQRTSVLAAANKEGRKFADFLQFEEVGTDGPPPPSGLGGDKAVELVDRASSLLAAAREALESVRQRDPADSRNRQTGSGITSSTSATASSSDANSGGRSGGATAAARGLTSFVWESDLDELDEGEAGSFVVGGSSRDSSPPSAAGGAGGDDASQSWSQAGLDSWFGDKVDTGPLQLRPTLKPVASQVSQVAVLERPAGPTTLEFGAPETPQAAGPSIFPASMQLHFQPPEAEAAAAPPASEEAAAEAPPAEAPEGSWERRSGEEMGAHGYWYRWTEVRGCDDAGVVQWYEKWWEVSDWKGMKEMGAEKWGCNARGDAWRETWREAIVVDDASGQPMVERSAHKWAKNEADNEWEEKWDERYWSAGRAEKSAYKWAKEGPDVWHEKWGETYDGAGACLKYTDKWAEREHFGGAREQWGDKWEENFAGGRGTKKGETWSVSGDGQRFSRWWGENHLGDRLVQKYGHSSTGEHWDHTEQMDTYYNPIPHFGYDLALSHSPQLRTVPTLPRDRDSLGSGNAIL